MSTESPYMTYTIGPNQNTDFGYEAPFSRYSPLGVVTPFFLLCKKSFLLGWDSNPGPWGLKPKFLTTRPPRLVGS